jgi:putative restriction endonuclease
MTVDRATRERVLARLASLRQHQQNGRRSPHKPLLVLLALGRVWNRGRSDLPWQEARTSLAALIDEFGPASTTAPAQSAAYPFTRLRADTVWVLDHDVPMDNVGPLGRHPVTGRFAPDIERALAADRDLVRLAARSLVDAHFPDTVAPDVLAAAGFDPEPVADPAVLPADAPGRRRRDPTWPGLVLQAWDRRCAFCGYDGRVGSAVVGVDAAHVRWFAFDGPDLLDNGLALCVLHHKLFDRGVLGLDPDLRIQVTGTYSASSRAGRAVYDLHGRPLSPRPGTPPPRSEHVRWHRREVFKGSPLAA